MIKFQMRKMCHSRKNPVPLQRVPIQKFLNILRVYLRLNSLGNIFCYLIPQCGNAEIFSATQLFREINFCRVSKTEPLKSSKKGHFCDLIFAKIDFTENLSDKKILRHPYNVGFLILGETLN